MIDWKGMKDIHLSMQRKTFKRRCSEFEVSNIILTWYKMKINQYKFSKVILWTLCFGKLSIKRGVYTIFTRGFQINNCVIPIHSASKKGIWSIRNSNFMQWLKSVILAIFQKRPGCLCSVNIGPQKVIICSIWKKNCFWILWISRKTRR